MNKMQQQVLEFHRVLGHTIGEVPGLRGVELRDSLIMEEAQETSDAIRAGDLAAAIDGLCDLLYVVFGAAITWGVNLEPFFDEVHRTNMLKATGPVRADGKRLKPEGWEPPRIWEILQDHTMMETER